MPFPENSIYVASKSFVNLLTETISKELQGTGVYVQVLCPGPTRTDILRKIGEDVDELSKNRSWLWKPMSSEEVVKKSLQYMRKNKAVCVPGMNNKINVIIRTLRRLF